MYRDEVKFIKKNMQFKQFKNNDQPEWCGMGEYFIILRVLVQ